jgi:large subunit ribosomal protein L10
MSKPVKNLITDSYKQRFGELEGAVLIDIRGIKSNDNNKIRNGLAQKQIRVTVVKNSLAKRALSGSRIDNLATLLDGPSAMVYGSDSVVSVAREVLTVIKGIENVVVKGAVMDGEIFPADRIEALSKYPTRVEAQGQVIQLFLSPARKLAGQFLGPGGKIAALIKAVIEKREKEGEGGAGAEAPAPAEPAAAPA